MLCQCFFFGIRAGIQWVSHGGSNGDFLSLEVVIGLLSTDQECDIVPTALDSVHHLLIGFIQHILSIHFNDDILIL
jgi:hypothetical protein